MIKSIKIENFQSHKETELEFHPGVNVLIGRSHHGKTALLRALNWIINNRPNGTAFRSRWCDKKDATSATVIMTDGTKVERIKSSKENEYHLNDEVYKATGVDMPEEVVTALNMSPINIQYQMDAPFLLASTAGEVARQLNKVANLDIIDTTLSSINAMVRGNTQEISRHRADSIDLEASLKEYTWLDKAEVSLKVLEGEQGKVLGIQQREQQLNALVHAIKEAQANQIDTKGLDKAKTEFNNLLVLYAEVNALDTKADALADIITDINKYKEAKELELQSLENLQIQYKAIAPDMCPLCGGKWEASE